MSPDASEAAPRFFSSPLRLRGEGRGEVGVCYLSPMQQMTSTQLYFRLLRYVKPYWGVFALSIVGMLLTAATEVALPMAVKPFLDGTFVKKDPFLIAWVPVFMVLLYVVRGAATYMGTYASAWVGNRVVMDLRDLMFRRMLALPLGFFHDNTTGNLISRFTFDVSQVTGAATNVVTVLIKDSVTILGLLAYLLYTDWKLTLISLIMVPPIALVVRYFNVRLRNMSRKTQDAMGDITQVLQETVECNKVVKIFAGQEYEAQRFAVTSNRLRGFSMKQTAAAAGNVPIVQLLAAIAVAVVVYYATVQAQSDATTVGGFVSFLAAMLLLTSPLKRLTGVAEHLQRGLAAAESVFVLLDEKPEKDDGQVTLERVTRRNFLSPGNFPLSPRRTARIEGCLVVDSGRGKHSAGRIFRRRKNHVREPGATFLSSGFRNHHDRWSRHRSAVACQPAPKHCAGESGGRVVQRYGRSKHCVRSDSGREPTGDRKCRSRGARAGIHSRNAAGLRYPDRGKWRQIVGRATPAIGDRTHDIEGCADPDSGRSNIGARFGVGETCAGCAGTPDAGAYEHRHCPPPVDD